MKYYLDEWAFIFEERAAIMEYDGGLPRPEAEEQARQCVARLKEQERLAHQQQLSLLERK